jgi:NAD dependent epimerase/dehydratase
VTVLVTGAGGFIGSHLVEALLARGTAVRALVRYVGDGGWHHLDHLREARPEGLEVVAGDISDARLVATASEGCDAVLHLAALIGIPYSYVAPASYVATNVTGTLNVLEAARTHGVRRVVVTSTSEVYGTARETPMTERHVLQAQSPYSATKIAADKLADAYALSFGLPVVVLRPFNTYGPRQSTRAVIPTVLSQLLAGGEVELGNLAPRRDFTYVSDTVAGFMAALDTPGVEGETVHLGTGTDISVGELVELCAEVVGVRAPVRVAEERTRKAGSEVDQLLSDPTRARELLGWAPQVDLAEGLRRTADWLRDRPVPRGYAL